MAIADLGSRRPNASAPPSRRASPQAEAAGIELLIETAPPLYADSNIAHTLRDAVTLAEMAGIGVCIDLFALLDRGGAARDDRRAPCRAATWSRSATTCSATERCPCRAVPGDGVIPLGAHLDWMLAAGYKGAFDLELIGPRIDAGRPLEAVGRAAEKVGEMLILGRIARRLDRVK